VRHAVEEGLLVKGGGHAMAAGVTLARDRLGAFRAFLEERLAEAVSGARAEASLAIDGALTATGATAALVETIARAGPFGQGNAEPVFALPDHVIAFAEEAAGAHLRLRLKDSAGGMLDAIAFRCLGQPLGDALRKARGQRLHIVGTLSLDRWGGRERVQLRVIDAAAG
jgi:single-stranded-DNA-specific exonuclease